jgi:tetratricopeptide (TPR) repeat protein
MSVRLLMLAGFGLLLACGPTAGTVHKNKVDARYHYDLAYGYYFDPQNPRANLAIREVLTSLELNAEDSEAQLLAGLIFLGRQDHLKAIKHFQHAIKIKPDYYFARNNLGVTYLSLERWDDAITIFEKLIRAPLYTQQGHAHNNLGWAWYKKGDLSRAAGAFLTATAVAPKLCPPYNNHAIVLLEQKRYARALRSIDRGIALCPTYAEAHFNRGRALSKLGQTAEARGAFSACMRKAGDSPLGDRCADHLGRLGNVQR